MEPTVETLLPDLRNKMAVIEAIELPTLVFVVWYLLSLEDLKQPDVRLMDQVNILIGLQIIVVGSWLLYNAYIFLARIGGPKVDVAIWIIAGTATASYTLWAWTSLDINRWIMAKLFYRGEAPVEYAWSARSKLLRKAWEQARKLSAKPEM